MNDDSNDDVWTIYPRIKVPEIYIEHFSSELQLNIPVGLTQIEQQIPALNIHEDIPQIDDY